MLLKENQAFTTKPLNIYSSPSQQSSLLSAWPAYQKVNVLSHHDVEWKKSRVNSLGTIWWQAPSSQKKKVIRKTQKKEKFDAIFDIASSPRSSKVKLISASGIFLQKDGKTKRLSFFKNNNHPLSIAENGTFFIGPYLSTNQGQSFQPYIDWPSMANVLKLKSLKSIKVQDIVIKDKVGQELSIEVQSSRGKNILYSRNQGKSWTLVQ